MSASSSGRGARARIVVADVLGDYQRLFDSVTSDARHIDDAERLADDVSAIFGTHVRLSRREIDDVEELVFKVG